MAEGVLKIHLATGDVEVPRVSDHGALTGLGDNDHPQYALAATAVVAAAVIADNAIVAGDGGARGVQGRTPTIADNGVMSVPGLGTGGVTDYDLRVGNVTAPSYGMIQIGNACIGRTSFDVGAIDLNGTILCQNKGGPVTGDIEFIWTESTGGTARFALPKSGVGLATYNSRSMLLAGPAPADTDFVKVSYWQTQGIFHNLVCDTIGDGADLGVQNDLEVEGIIYADNLLESTTDAGITADRVVLQDGQVGLEDTDASHHLLLDAGSDLTADRVLTIVTGDENRTLTVGGTTHRIPILGWGTVPDDSGEVFFEPYSIKATNDVWKRLVGIFNDSSTRNGLHGGFAVPKDYAGTLAKIIIVWTAAATSGDVEWDFDYRAVGGNDTESLDQTGNQESLNTNDTAPSAIHERMEVALTLVHGNLAVDDEVEFTFFRDGTDAGDTMAASAILFGLYFEYED